MFQFLQFFHPNLLIETIDSPLNGKIEVRLEFGKPRAWTGGIPQSGGIVTDILKKALNEFNRPKNLLLLGLGGGDILWQIHRRWPNCQITAVEIDPIMVNIAKKHFHIDRVPNLKVVTADASQFVQKAKSYQPTANFDAILIDCYLGTQIPPQLESPKFLKNLSHILTPSGIITFNRLYAKPTQPQTQKFIQTLKTIFPVVFTKPAYCNLIVIAQSKPQPLNPKPLLT